MGSSSSKRNNTNHGYEYNSNYNEKNTIACEDFFHDEGYDYKSTSPYQHVVYRASKAGFYKAVEYWIEKEGFDVNEKDFYGNTILYYAALCGHISIVHGAHFSRQDRDGKRTYVAAPDSIRDILRNVNQGFVASEPETWFTNFLDNSDFKNYLIKYRPYLETKEVVIGKGIKKTEALELLSYIYSNKTQGKSLGQIHTRLSSFFGINFKFSDRGLVTDIGKSTLELFNNPTYHDVLIKGSDGEQYYAHKVILCHKSDYFKAYFSTNWQHDNNALPAVSINDVSPEILQIILKYIYSRQYSVDSTNILDVIIAADLFLLLALKLELENKVIKDFLDDDSCVDLFSFSETLNLQSLKKVCIAKIKVKKNIMETEKFNELPQHMKQQLQQKISPS